MGEKSRDRIIEATDETDLIAPASLHWEIGNAFSAMLKRGRLVVSVAVKALERYQTIPIQFVEVELREAIRLASKLDLYAYDAYMLTVARRHRAPLLTLDRGLQQAARKTNVNLLEVTS